MCKLTLPITTKVWSGIQESYHEYQMAPCSLRRVGCASALALAALVTAVVMPLFLSIDLLWNLVKSIRGERVSPQKGSAEDPSKKVDKVVQPQINPRAKFKSESSLQRRSSELLPRPSVVPSSVAIVKPATKKREAPMSSVARTLKSVVTPARAPTVLASTAGGPLLTLSISAEEIGEFQGWHDRQVALGFFTVLESPAATCIKIPLFIQKHHNQLHLFEQWAAGRKWKAFKVRHYDWWAFPLCRMSQMGEKYSISLPQIQDLKSDPAFMKNYRRAVFLMLESWGWDPHTHSLIASRDADQEWIPSYSGYMGDRVVRLAKIVDSVRLFGQWDLFKEVRTFAQQCVFDRSAEDPDIDWLKRDLFLT